MRSSVHGRVHAELWLYSLKTEEEDLIPAEFTNLAPGQHGMVEMAERRM